MIKHPPETVAWWHDFDAHTAAARALISGGATGSVWFDNIRCDRCDAIIPCVYFSGGLIATQNIENIEGKFRISGTRVHRRHVVRPCPACGAVKRIYPSKPR
jgi:hypothetical protein